MNKYVTTFNNKTIEELNDRALVEEVIITCPNTLCLNFNILNSLNPNIIIRIVGPLEKQKYLKRDFINITTYTLLELKYIINSFLKIENMLNNSWSSYKKSLFIYNYLSQYIFCSKDVCLDEDSSLRGIFTRNTDSFGASLIFKEMMDRQHINCDLVRGVNNIYFNVLSINGLFHPLDLSKESEERHKVTYKNLKYFDSSTKFSLEHKADADEKVYDYPKTNNNQETILKEFKEINNIETQYIRRKEEGFFLALIASFEIDSIKMYKYMQCEINNDDSLGICNILFSENNIYDLNEEELYSFANELCEKSRIKKYVLDNYGYIGFISSKEGLDSRIIINKSMHLKIKDYLKEKVFYRNFVRFDNTNLSISEGSNSYSDIDIYNYDCYEFICNEDGDVFAKVDNIYSEEKIFFLDEETQKYVVSYLLSRDRIDEKEENYAGYVGHLILKDGKYVKIVDKSKYNYITSL